MPVSRSEAVHFLVVTHCGSYIVSTKIVFGILSKKSYNHKIARRMRVDTFNKPLHHNITSTGELFKSLHAGNFDIILLSLS